MAIKAKTLKVIHTCGSLSHPHDVIGNTHAPTSPASVLWRLGDSNGYIESVVHNSEIGLIPLYSGLVPLNLQVD